ncbi:MAG: hypothetical protein EPN79_11650 [Burkholderiaceae bacterium]|nr:MAG: hypothetical protein EPN79_11650 [Burkholderiaceae bacterium]TBR76689.1 MAG: hypothetical protein EPN64_05415 [Burkholderiaceae bacterium]
MNTTTSDQDIVLHRKNNVQFLFKEFARAAIAADTPPNGIEKAFAAHIQVHPTMWSQIKGVRIINDKLARQIEKHCRRPVGWLDYERDEQEKTAADAAEQRFLELAARVWRASNSKGKRALRTHLMEIELVQERADD